MDIIEWGWTVVYEPGKGWFDINCKGCLYSMYIEYGRVQHGVYVDSENYKTIYPYRYNSKYGWCNCTGEYTLPYFKRLFKDDKIILK